MKVKHTFKTKNGVRTAKLTPLQAIKQKCLDCSGWSRTEVKHCPIKDCALYPFRFGKVEEK